MLNQNVQRFEQALRNGVPLLLAVPLKIFEVLLRLLRVLLGLTKHIVGFQLQFLDVLLYSLDFERYRKEKGQSRALRRRKSSTSLSDGIGSFLFLHLVGMFCFVELTLKQEDGIIQLVANLLASLFNLARFHLLVLKRMKFGIKELLKLLQLWLALSVCVWSACTLIKVREGNTF